ncbi:hypothetical protein TNCV_3089921 [Trichonephila clavipes]|nr:hypothetical protein TNCV_3089921 [Trichonephila clavipes]
MFSSVVAVFGCPECSSPPKLLRSRLNSAVQNFTSWPELQKTTTRQGGRNKNKQNKVGNNNVTRKVYEPNKFQVCPYKDRTKRSPLVMGSGECGQHPYPPKYHRARRMGSLQHEFD